jgi:ABC-type Fe3+ transport system substrate-binding protein
MISAFCLIKDAPHPNAVKLYLTWFLAKEQQSRLGSFSSRVDVPPARRLPTVRVLLNCQQLSGVHDQRQAGRRPAQAIEGYTGPAGQQGRGEMSTLVTILWS